MFRIQFAHTQTLHLNFTNWLAESCLKWFRINKKYVLQACQTVLHEKLVRCTHSTLYKPGLSNQATYTKQPNKYKLLPAITVKVALLLQKIPLNADMTLVLTMYVPIRALYCSIVIPILHLH